MQTESSNLAMKPREERHFKHINDYSKFDPPLTNLIDKTNEHYPQDWQESLIWPQVDNSTRETIEELGPLSWQSFPFNENLPTVSSIVNERGSYYKGQVKKGHPHGFGVMVFQDGDRWEGTWTNGTIDQYYRCIFGAGSSYKYYEGGVDTIFGKHGQGTLAWKNGDLYTGDWVRDKREGTGTMKCSDGSCYIGGWKKNKKNGKGKMQYADGRVYDGEWHEDEWVKGKVSGVMCDK